MAFTRKKAAYQCVSPAITTHLLKKATVHSVTSASAHDKSICSTIGAVDGTIGELPRVICADEFSHLKRIASPCGINQQSEPALVFPPNMEEVKHSACIQCDNMVTGSDSEIPCRDVRGRVNFSLAPGCSTAENNDERAIVVLPAIVVQKHTPRGIKACSKCGKEFIRTDALQMHYSSVHCKEKRFSCPNCGKKFGWKVSVRRHIESVHSGAGRKRRHPPRVAQLWHGQPLISDSELEECIKRAKPLPPNVTVRLL